MKALIYLVALLLMLVMLVLLAITIAHLPWWAAVLVVGLAALMLHAGAPLLFGVAAFAEMSGEVLPLLRHGLLVHGIERCEEVDDPELAMYWLDVTVTPQRREGRPNDWAPSELQVMAVAEPSPAKPARRRGRACGCAGAERPEISVVRVLVHEGGEFVPLAHGLLDGEQRVRLKFIAPAAVRRVMVGIGIAWSATLYLPEPAQEAKP